MTRNPTLPGFEHVLPAKSASPVRELSDFTAREVAHVFGVTVQALDGWLRSGCPSNPDTSPRTFDLPSVVAWRRKRDQENAATLVGDPMLSGPKSPELERYRKFQANRAELAFNRDKGKLIDKATVTRMATRIGNKLKAEFEAFVKLNPDHKDDIQGPIDRAAKALKA